MRHYYIDLGAGSYIFQIALGFLLGGIAYLGYYWHRLFKKNKKHEDEQNNQDDKERR